ncbi:MAG TPA: 3'(2'),5'-bisphosphate nucleotidase CysQ [Bacteroidia bacterium]|nr:3'(2'),5'-bisphosphate nucleotidase CysQ [Bacteroidia bacterium]
MNSPVSERTLIEAIRLSIEAGKAIMQVYAQPFEVEYKEDHSPLTQADKVSNDVLSKGLTATECKQILSEEMAEVPFSERKSWKSFWLVDPLDGTKEFVKRNGEFTVNVALITDGLPVFGIIYLPVHQMLYVGIKGQGAYRILNAANKALPKNKEEFMKVAEKLPLAQAKRDYTIVASRSHMSPETEAFVAKEKEKHGQVQLVSAGSSIKFCLVAEGKADAYPRYAPTMEWDTGAGHIIAEEIGKKVLRADTNTPLTYNKENLLNPYFLVTS